MYNFQSESKKEQLLMNNWGCRSATIFSI